MTVSRVPLLATTLPSRKTSTDFDSMLRRLERYRGEHGHAKVPIRYAEDRELAAWVFAQRRMFKEGRLDRERKAALDALGFAWSADDAKQDDLWERRLREILEWKKKLGHLRIGKAHPGDATPLEVWIFKQRRLHKRGQLDPAREAKLEAIGFEWDVRAAQWQLMFERLEDYKRAHGHCSPPRRYSGDDQLAVWVQNQRIFKRKGKLSPSRIAAMEALGFDWEPKQVVKPEDRLAELREFRQRHGHLAVPFKGNSGLVQWMLHKQKLHAEGKLDRRLQIQLDKLGFPWNEEEKQWEWWFARSQELVERTGGFAAKSGTEVAEWLAEQRQKMERGQLELDRADRLARIGFWKWSAKNARR